MPMKEWAYILEILEVLGLTEVFDLVFPEIAFPELGEILKRFQGADLVHR